MADVVQYRLERMLPELDDLERRGLFSRQEIAEIVKQRRKFEYRLKRPSPLKHDFIAYIDYEKQVDSLRRLRKKSFMKKTGGKKSKNSISDYAGVTRIIDIYRLATSRFKGDIELWFQYLEFCRARGHGRMKKALAQLVRYHPKVPGVWIYAAAWEFDSNGNTAAARALMLNGLRACPSSEDLRVEYLRMELTHLNKLATRKVMLGEGGETLTIDQKKADDSEWRDENKELFMALNEGGVDGKTSAVRDGESEGKVDLLREHGLSILQVVYSDAIQALPASFSLRTRFLEILEAMRFPHAEEMRKKILDDMKRDFLKEPQYWNWLARVEIADLKVANSEQLGKAIQVYEEGLKFSASDEMFKLYVQFLMEAISNKNKDEEANMPSDSDCPNIDLISHLQKILEKAESMGCITEDLAVKHALFLLQLGKMEDAKVLLKKFCSGKFSGSPELCSLLLSIEMRCVQDKSPSPSKADLTSVFELSKNILVNVGIPNSEKLWLMGLKYFTNHRRYFDKLVETSLYLLTRDGGSDNSFSLSSTIVNCVLQRDGFESAREIYKRFLALPHPGLAIYRNCIELELNLASTGDKMGLSNARKLFESALGTYDQDISLWRDYYSMESKMGTSETAAAVTWRARKALKSSAVILSSTSS